MAAAKSINKAPLVRISVQLDGTMIGKYIGCIATTCRMQHHGITAGAI